MRHRTKLVLLSLAAIILFFVNLPSCLGWVKPILPLLLIFYCTLVASRVTTMLLLVFWGFCLDFMMGTAVGTNGVGICVSVIILSLFKNRLITSNFKRLHLLIFLLLGVYQLVMNGLCSYLGYTTSAWSILALALVGVLGFQVSFSQAVLNYKRRF